MHILSQPALKAKGIRNAWLGSWVSSTPHFFSSSAAFLFLLQARRELDRGGGRRVTVRLADVGMQGSQVGGGGGGNAREFLPGTRWHSWPVGCFYICLISPDFFRMCDLLFTSQLQRGAKVSEAGSHPENMTIVESKSLSLTGTAPVPNMLVCNGLFTWPVVMLVAALFLKM